MTIKTLWRLVVISGLLLVVNLREDSPSASAGGGNKNPGVIPPNARFRGQSYADLEAQFWQALFDIPVVDGNHPLFTGGPVAGDNGIVFLTAPFGGADLEVTIPPGTGLFVPIVNAEVSELEPDPFHGDDEAEQRAQANAWMDGAYDLAVTIDGKPINNLETAYRFESAQFTFGPLPEDNIFEFFGLDAPAGTTSTAVDAGFYVLLSPFSVGEHELHIAGALDPFTPDDPSDDLIIDTTFLITVTNK